MTTIVDVNLLKKYDEKVKSNISKLYIKKTDVQTVPTKVSQLQNDSGFITTNDVGSSANKIAKFNSEGHLVLPSGIELY